MGTRPNPQTDIHADIDAIVTPGTASGLTVTETGCGPYRQTVIELDSVVQALTDTGGANGAYGALLLCTLPAGVNQVFGVHVDLVDGNTVPSGNAYGIARVGTNIGATATIKFSVGTAAEATNDTLDSTQANLVASVSCVLVAGASTGRGISVAPLAPFDGTTTPTPIYLNIGIADAGIGGADSVRLRGRVTINWSPMGD